MKITTTLELDRTRLLWGETTRGVTAITNGGDSALEFLNHANENAMPVFILVNSQTGEATEYAAPIVLGATPYEITVEAGKTWQAEFKLCYKCQFPSTGLFMVKTRFEWYDGSIESEAVSVEVLPAAPLASRIETTGGGPVGDVFCAWVNREENGAGLWLSSIGAVTEARLQESHRLCDISPEALPVLSIPPNTSPTSQYIGWINEQTLRWATYTHGQIQTDQLELDGNNYQIIPPLLEDQFIQPDVKQNAEALLVCVTETSWGVCVATLNANKTLREVLQIGGSLPCHSYTAYRSDAARRTFFCQQDIFSDRTGAVTLSVSKWAKGENLQAPELKTIWAGRFVAANQSLTGDDAVIGAVLLRVNQNTHDYKLHTWRLEVNDTFIESSATEIPWQFSALIEEAVIGIRPDENVFALLLNSEDKLWRLLGNDNQLNLLPDSLQKIGKKPNIFFVNQSTPAILYSDPEAGLRIGFDRPAPKKVSPAGY